MGKNASDTGAEKTQKHKAAEARAERLRQQLRANLQRRKAQGRARKAQDENDGQD
jgi:hypothetical protein